MQYESLCVTCDRTRARERACIALTLRKRVYSFLARLFVAHAAAREHANARIALKIWLIHMWDMTHSYVGHDSFICETWLIHLWHVTQSYVGHADEYVRHVLFMCGTSRSHVWNMLNLYVGYKPSYIWMRHDSHMRVLRINEVRPTYKRGMYQVWMSYVPYMNEARLTYVISHEGIPLTYHMWVVPHSYMGHDSFILGTCLIHTLDVTHIYVGHDSLVRDIDAIICDINRVKCVEAKHLRRPEPSRTDLGPDSLVVVHHV